MARRRHAARRWPDRRKPLAKMARKSFSSGVIGFRALGLILPRPGCRRREFSARYADAGFIEVLQRFSETSEGRGDDFLRTSWYRRAITSIPRCDRGEDVVFTQSLGEQDRIFEVVGHSTAERDQHVAAESELAEIESKDVGDDVQPWRTRSPTFPAALVDEGRCVGSAGTSSGGRYRRPIGGSSFMVRG